jgi:uncharacterized protein DUF6338
MLLVLRAPGLAYVLRREKVVPTGPRTAFREALQVIFVSVACLTAVGLLATLLRVIAAGHTLDVRGLVQAWASFARGHHVQLAWWVLRPHRGRRAAGLCSGGSPADPCPATVGPATSDQLADRSEQRRHRGDVSMVAGLEEQKPPDAGLTTVGVLKDDGTYVQGPAAGTG